MADIVDINGLRNGGKTNSNQRWNKLRLKLMLNFKHTKEANKNSKN